MYTQRQVAGGQEGVDPLVGGSRVGLQTLGAHFKPTDVLFGYLDLCALGVASVGDDDNIFLIKERIILDKVLDSERGAHFLVSHEEQFDSTLGHESLLHKGQGREHRSYKPLLVVFDTSAYHRPVLDDHLPGIGMPERSFALGHHVQVGHDPEPGCIVLALDGRHKVGANARDDSVVLGIHADDVGNAMSLEPHFQGQSLVQLALPARFRRQGRDRGQKGFELHNAVRALFDVGKNLVFHTMLLAVVLPFEIQFYAAARAQAL